MRGVPRERLAISFRAVVGEREADHPGAARDDALQFVGGIKIEPDRNAETVAQGGGEEPRAGRRADEGEPGEVDLHRARRRAGADNEVKLEILHRRIKDLFDRRVQAMNLIDEQDVARLEIGELRREVPRLDDDGSGGRAEIDAELARHDLRQRRLAEAGRADEQHVIERLAARLRRCDEDPEILARRFLPGEIREELGANRRLVLGALFGGDETAGRVGQIRRLRSREGREPPASG